MTKGHPVVALRPYRRLGRAAASTCAHGANVPTRGFGSPVAVSLRPLQGPALDPARPHPTGPARPAALRPAWGGDADRRRARPRRAGTHRRTRSAHLRRARRADQRAGQRVAAARPGPGRRRGDPGRQSPGLPGSGLRRRQVRRRCPAAQHRLRGRPAGRDAVPRTSRPAGLRRGVRRRRRGRAAEVGPDPGLDPDARPRQPGRADRARRSRPAAPIGWAAQDRHLDQRHDGSAEGRRAFGTQFADTGRRPARQGPAPRPGSHRMLCAAVSFDGLQRRDVRDGARLDPGAAPPLRPPAGAGRCGRAPGQRHDRRPDHVAAHPRAGAGGPGRTRPVVAAHRVRRRFAARGRAGYPGARGAGSCGLQHVRLHRGRLRHHRHARRPRRRAGLRGRGGARLGRQGFLRQRP